MNYVIDILKGYAMGISNVIPGVSGSTIAVVMGIYEKLINAINNIFKHPIQTLKEIWTYLVGMIIGVVFGVFFISYALDYYPLITSSLFIGLIIGVIPQIYIKIDKSKLNKKHIITFVITFILIVMLPILSSLNIVSNGGNIFIYFFIGIISAGTMIIPGISGSMILMALGYYNDLMKLISNTIKDLVNLNFSAVNENIWLLLAFGIGIIVGIIVIAKLIKYLFNKYNLITNVIIFGLILASPIVVLFEVNYANVNFITIIFSIITLVIGYYITKVFNKMNGGEK